MSREERHYDAFCSLGLYRRLTAGSLVVINGSLCLAKDAILLDHARIWKFLPGDAGNLSARGLVGQGFPSAIWQNDSIWAEHSSAIMLSYAVLGRVNIFVRAPQTNRARRHKGCTFKSCTILLEMNLVYEGDNTTPVSISCAVCVGSKSWTLGSFCTDIRQCDFILGECVTVQEYGRIYMRYSRRMAAVYIKLKNGATDGLSFLN